MLLTIKTPYTCMEFQVTSMQARQLIDEAYQMAVSTLNEEDSNNPLFCPPFDLPDVSEFDEAPDNSEFVIGPAASKNIEDLPAVEDLFQQDSSLLLTITALSLDITFSFTLILILATHWRTWVLHQSQTSLYSIALACQRHSMDRVSVPMWGTFLSEPLLIVALVGRYPANKLIRRIPIHHR